MKEEKKNFYPKAVVFDMDGIMFDSRESYSIHLIRQGKRWGMVFSEMKIYVLRWG